MRKVAVVYWSGTGNTEAMANLVAQGAGAADIFTSAEFTAEKVKAYDAIAFGCPSMGAEQLEETEFEPMFQAVKPVLTGKRIALFGSYGWGDGEWMRIWEQECISAGCQMVTDAVIVCGAPDDDAAQICKDLGAALAK